MDRVQFMQSIQLKDHSLADTIVDFLDHNMFLYELVGETGNISIVDDSKKHSISFQIDDKADSIRDIKKKLDNVPEYIIEYEIPLTVESSMISNKSIVVTVSSNFSLVQ